MKKRLKKIGAFILAVLLINILVMFCTYLCKGNIIEVLKMFLVVAFGTIVGAIVMIGLLFVILLLIKYAFEKEYVIEED